MVSASAESERAVGLGDGSEHCINVKHGAEIHLTRTDLGWIIVRPGHLIEGAGGGLIAAGLALRDADIRRENLGLFVIVRAVHNPELNRTIVEVTDGHTPIGDAVTQVAHSVGPSCNREPSGREQPKS